MARTSTRDTRGQRRVKFMVRIYPPRFRPIVGVRFTTTVRPAIRFRTRVVSPLG